MAQLHIVLIMGGIMEPPIIIVAVGLVFVIALGIPLLLMGKTTIVMGSLMNTRRNFFAAPRTLPTTRLHAVIGAPRQEGCALIHARALVVEHAPLRAQPR